MEHVSPWQFFTLSLFLHLYRSTNTISPPDLCPIMQDLNPIQLSRKIDYCLSLKTSINERDLIQDAFQKLPLDRRSINQSFKHPNEPTCLDIGVKLPSSTVDGMVQLATWTAAGYKKKTNAGFDISLPIPLMAVYGDIWQLWIGFSLNGKIVSSRSKLCNHLY